MNSLRNKIKDKINKAQTITISTDTGYIGNCNLLGRASPGAQSVKNLPAMQETWVRSLGWEDPLEKETAIHSISISCARGSLLHIPQVLDPGIVHR